MYIYTKLELINHPEFWNAILLCEMQTNAEWRSIYRDKSGELAITFYGRLSEANIKTVLMHFKDLIDGDTSTNDISCRYSTDYEYFFDHSKDTTTDITQIFTPDGYDYSQF